LGCVLWAFGFAVVAVVGVLVDPEVVVFCVEDPHAAATRAIATAASDAVAVGRRFLISSE
jgi:hypothetical protein